MQNSTSVEKLSIHLIQVDLAWENKEENLKTIQLQIEKLPECADLVILPEMFSTGFTMNPELVAETMSGKTVRWMIEMAAKFEIALVGSIVIIEAERHYNRLLFVNKDGVLETYDKRHLFSYAGEDKVYTAGSARKIINYKGWNICLQICYDLRFPVFCRNHGEYDLLLFVANWPESRILAWDTLIKARAIENICYVAGVNRIGADKHNYNHNGHSQLVNFLGEYLIKPQENPAAFHFTIEKQPLLETREKLGFLNDADHFTLE